MRRSNLSVEDIDLAIEFKERGETWRTIGYEIARRRGRKMPFLGTSVANRVRPFMQATNPEK